MRGRAPGLKAGMAGIFRERERLYGSCVSRAASVALPVLPAQISVGAAPERRGRASYPGPAPASAENPPLTGTGTQVPAPS